MSTRQLTVDFFSRAASGRGNSTRVTTPVELSLAPRETIKVTDPCHPLYGHALQLVGIITTAHAGQCCVVLTPAGCELRLPIALTDLVLESQARYSLPLNFRSVEQLLCAFNRILSQLKEREDAKSSHYADDATLVQAHNPATDISAGTDHSSASLAAPVSDAAASSATSAHQRLPRSYHRDVSQYRKRGGA